MKATHHLPLLLFILFFGQACNDSAPAPIDDNTTSPKNDKPTVSFTFDDGITYDIVDFKFKVWNNLILEALDEADLKAIFFVTGFNKTDLKGRFLLEEWDQRGHGIANHTFSHPYFHDKNNTPEILEDELLRTDSIIKSYNNYLKLFRFPYLKEGQTRGKIDSMRAILNRHQYRNGYVTIDASDWYVNSRLIKQLKNQKEIDTLAFQAFYLEHLLDRANFYESISHKITGRHIKHTLLLHHNLTSALFLKPLIQRFKAEGWEVIDAQTAYEDPIYDAIPTVVPAGESLIWSLAKESGQFEDHLRYPAEDSRYEKEAMDQLGL